MAPRTKPLLTTTISVLLLVLAGGAPPARSQPGPPEQALPHASSSERLAREAYDKGVRRDVRRLRRQCRFLDDVLVRVGEQRAVLERAKQPRTVLALPERRLLEGLWQQFFLGYEDLHELARTYQVQVEAADHRTVDSYDGRLLGTTARVARLLYGLRWLERTGESEALAMLFDETLAGRGLERGTYQRFRGALDDVPDRLWLLHFAKYEVARPLDPARERSAAREDTWIEGFWQAHSRELFARLYASDQLAGRDDATAPRPRERSWDDRLQQVVKPFAIFMGATKVKRLDSQLITTEQIRGLLPVLEPGDIFLEKTTYYLSNFFITGFWGHTGIYIGSHADAMRYFDTPEVQAHARAQGHPSLAAWLDARYPEAMAQWRSSDASGAPMRVLEGDGVKSTSVFFNTLEDAFAADYIAVLRPRLERLDKALALVDAIAYWKAEYDFAFDVRSDSALVCTELLAKAYAEGPGKRGVRFPVGDATAGRYVVYPNGIAAMYTAERGRPDQQLGFVTFLRALEGTRRALPASEEVFAESHTWESTL